MSSGRLKAINSQALPKSTLGRSLGGPPRHGSHDASSYEPPAKRQRQDNSIVSRFFVSPTTRQESRDPIKDDEVSLVPTSFPSNAEDIEEVESVSSATIPTASAAVNQNEFRKTQSQSTITTRRRRRTQTSRPGDDRERPGKSVAAGPLYLDRLQSAPSPDQLIIDDDDDDVDNPPPANVVSDLVSPKATKRQASPHARFPEANKRQKRLAPHELGSEDELQRPDSDSPVVRGQKGPGPLSLHQALKSASRPQRGDIQPTRFQTPKKITPRPGLTSKPAPIPDFVIVKAAASGNYTTSEYFDSEENNLENIILEHDPDQLKIKQSPGPRQAFSWLQVQKSLVTKVKHAATHSEFAVLELRSSPPRLVLRFDSATGVTHLVDWLKSAGIDFQEESSTEIKKIFDNLYEKSVQYKRSAQARDSRVAPVTVPHSIEDNPPAKDPFQGEAVVPRAKKLKDQMQGAPEDANREEAASKPIATRTRGPETRRTRRSDPVYSLPEPVFDRWTVRNPKWEKDWEKSLVFPPTGKNRATVDQDDIPRLDEGEFLNDNLINFYVRYLQARVETERPEVMHKMHFFSTFFFEKLKQNRGKINYDGVKAWTSKIDLFSYPYIFVPVNENAHWYLAIICNAPRLLPEMETQTKEESHREQAKTSSSPKLSPVARELATISLNDDGIEPANNDIAAAPVDDKTPTTEQNSTSVKVGKRNQIGGSQRYNPDRPKIITLDSLGGTHSPTCKGLKEYLIQEAKHKRQIDIEPGPPGMTVQRIPQQDNYCDCGVFVLGYMEKILQNPDEAIRKLLQKEELDWDVNPSTIRNKVRELLFKLQKEQIKRLQEEATTKKNHKKAAKQQGNVSSQKGPTEPAVKSPSSAEASKGSPPKAGAGSPNADVDKPEAEAPRPSVEQGPKQVTEDGERKADVQGPGKEETSHEEKTSGTLDECNSPEPLAKADSSSTRSTPVPRTGKSLATKLTSPKFIKKLSSSPPSSPRRPAPAEKEKRSSSPEEVVYVQSRRGFVRAKQNLDVGELASPVLPSMEDNELDEPRGLQYDGVDRSIDLTS